MSLHLAVPQTFLPSSFFREIDKKFSVEPENALHINTFARLSVDLHVNSVFFLTGGSLVSFKIQMYPQNLQGFGN